MCTQMFKHVTCINMSVTPRVNNSSKTSLNAEEFAWNVYTILVIERESHKQLSEQLPVFKGLLHANILSHERKVLGHDGMEMYWVKCIGTSVLSQMYWDKCIESNVLGQVFWVKCIRSNVLSQMYEHCHHNQKVNTLNRISAKWHLSNAKSSNECVSIENKINNNYTITFFIESFALTPTNK